MSTLLYHPLEIDCITFKKVAPRINRDALFQETRWWAQSAGSLSYRNADNAWKNLLKTTVSTLRDISIFISWTSKCKVWLTTFVFLNVSLGNIRVCVKWTAPEHSWWCIPLFKSVCVTSDMKFVEYFWRMWVISDGKQCSYKVLVRCYAKCTSVFL